MISNSGTTSLGLYDFKRQIDAFGGVDYFRPTLAGGYLPNARVMLSNGEIVQNDTNGNLTNDPNVDMTGWVKTNSASQVFDESGLSQQDINDSSKRLSGNVLDYFTKSELEAWEADQENFDASDAIIRAQVMSKSNEITFPTGTFRTTKQIPSAKSWRGVKGSFQTRGTRIIVDSVTPINPLIVQTFGGSEVNDIYFTSKQDKLHTIYKDNGYICKHSGLRVEKFAVGFDVNGTYDYFEDCDFWHNGTGVKSRAVHKSIEGSEYTQSTMFGFTRCKFVYNDIGFDTSPNYSVGTDEDLINIPFIECGFELNNIGINSPQRTWYMTLLNCWFEANTTWSINAPTSHVLEINTRHNANSPKNVSPTEHSQILAMIAKLSEVTARKFSADEISKSLKFSDYYQPNGNSEFKGETLSQRFTDDSGGATAKIQFVREGAGSISGGSAIAFSTTNTSNLGQLVEQWRIDRKGDLRGKSGAAIYTTKIMYTNTVGDFAGSGSPEGVVVANPGSTYRRTDGNTPCFYVKESGVGSTGWVGK